MLEAVKLTHGGSKDHRVKDHRVIKSKVPEISHRSCVATAWVSKLAVFTVRYI